MSRPLLDLTGLTIETLQIGERVSGVHPRYTYTCLSCGKQGEGDARYLRKGCVRCRNKHPDLATKEPDYLVVTQESCFYTQKDKLLDAMRRYEDLRIYLNQARVYMREEDMELVLDFGHRYRGVSVRLPKGEQTTEYDLAKPLPLFEPTLEPEAQSSSSPSPFTQPEGSLRLEHEADWAWFTVEHPPIELMPAYIQEWSQDHQQPEYRKLVSNSGTYILFTERPPKAKIFGDNEDWDFAPAQPLTPLHHTKPWGAE